MFVMAAKIGTKRGVALADAGCRIITDYGLRNDSGAVLFSLLRYFTVSLLISRVARRVMRDAEK
jgi:hypothetical protein